MTLDICCYLVISIDFFCANVRGLDNKVALSVAKLSSNFIEESVD